jgi:hypothetical protein
MIVDRAAIPDELAARRAQRDSESSFTLAEDMVNYLMFAQDEDGFPPIEVHVSCGHQDEVRGYVRRIARERGFRIRTHRLDWGVLVMPQVVDVFDDEQFYLGAVPAAVPVEDRQRYCKLKKERTIRAMGSIGKQYH